MAKVVLICGKICSGKSFYAKELQKRYPAVILSCDELLMTLYDKDLQDKHDEIIDKIKEYLYHKSLEIISAGTNVILDFGFWTKVERQRVSEYYRNHHIETEWHYVTISDEEWHKNIKKRNKEVLNGISKDFYVDDGLLHKLESLFEEPENKEIDIVK